MADNTICWNNDPSGVDRSELFTSSYSQLMEIVIEARVWKGPCWRESFGGYNRARGYRSRGQLKVWNGPCWRDGFGGKQTGVEEGEL